MDKYGATVRLVVSERLINFILFLPRGFNYLAFPTEGNEERQKVRKAINKHTVKLQRQYR